MFRFLLPATIPGVAIILPIVAIDPLGFWGGFLTGGLVTNCIMRMALGFWLGCGSRKEKAMEALAMDRRFKSL